MNFARTLIAATLAATVVAAAAPAMASQRSTVKIINKSSVSVVAVYSAPTYRSRYGDIDLLGRYSLRPGYEVNVDFESDDAENECTQDVMARAANGQKWTKRMNVCTATTWTLVD